MRIAVIDDECPARRELMHQLLELLPDAQISEADNGAAALELFGQETFDLIFIDINLGDMKGTSLVSVAKRLMPQVQIVFATAYSEYAVQAFELGVDNYILKPFDPQKLERIVERCREHLPQTPENSLPGRLAVNSNRRIMLLDIQEIAYIETDNRGCIIHTANGDITENLPIGEYEKRLAACRFFRIHKSYLVNLDEVREIFPWHNNSFALKVAGFEENVLPVGRERIKGLRQLLSF